MFPNHQREFNCCTSNVLIVCAESALQDAERGNLTPGFSVSLVSPNINNNLNIETKRSANKVHQDGMTNMLFLLNIHTTASS